MVFFELCFLGDHKYWLILINFLNLANCFYLLYFFYLNYINFTCSLSEFSVLQIFWFFFTILISFNFFLSLLTCKVSCLSFLESIFLDLFVLYLFLFSFRLVFFYISLFYLLFVLIFSLSFFFSFKFITNDLFGLYLTHLLDLLIRLFKEFIILWRISVFCWNFLDIFFF